LVRNDDLSTPDAAAAQVPEHLDFAAELARDLFGRAWCRPEARDFDDLPPAVVRQRRERAAWRGCGA